VQYGTAGDKLNKSSKSKTKYTEPLKAYVNKTSLEHLKPATGYYYRVGSANTGWSAVYKFRTGPKVGDNAKIVIGLWSDTQNNERNYNFERKVVYLRDHDNRGSYH
jgi:phosphodiesterase/alkaline phosphatase D-like protein